MKKFGLIVASLLVAGVMLALFTGVMWAQSGGAGWYDIENSLRVYGDVDARDDVTITDDLTVGGDLTVAGASTTTGDLTASGAFNTGAQAATLTNDFALVPTTSYVEVTSAGAVGGVFSTTGVVEGQVIFLVNVGAQTITFTDTGTSKLSGNAALGANDTLTVIFDGTNYNEVAQQDN